VAVLAVLVAVAAMFAPVCDVSHDLTSAITLTPARAALCRAICLLVPVAACAAGVVVAAALSSWLLPMLCLPAFN